MNGDRDSNTSNQQCPSMKADVKTAKLMEVTCAELRGVTLEDLEEGKDYNQNILYEKLLKNCFKINFLWQTNLWAMNSSWPIPTQP